MEFFILSLSDFLNFVVVNIELLSVEGVLMELSLGKGGLFRVLEADKGVDGLILLREKLDVLNFSILSKKFFQLLSGSIRREVFDIEIASLFGVLVSEHFFGLFHLSVFLLEGFLHIDFFIFVF